MDLTGKIGLAQGISLLKQNNLGLQLGVTMKDARKYKIT